MKISANPIRIASPDLSRNVRQRRLNWLLVGGVAGGGVLLVAIVIIVVLMTRPSPLKSVAANRPVQTPAKSPAEKRNEKPAVKLPEPMPQPIPQPTPEPKPIPTPVEETQPKPVPEPPAKKPVEEKDVVVMDGVRIIPAHLAVNTTKANDCTVEISIKLPSLTKHDKI